MSHGKGLRLSSTLTNKPLTSLNQITQEFSMTRMSILLSTTSEARSAQGVPAAPLTAIRMAYPDSHVSAVLNGRCCCLIVDRALAVMILNSCKKWNDHNGHPS